jgi:hypothetical protein
LAPADKNGMNELDITRIEVFEDGHQTPGRDVIDYAERAHAGHTDAGGCKLAEGLAVICFDLPFN